MNLIKYKLPKRYGGNIRVFYSRKEYGALKKFKLVKKEKVFFKKFDNLNKSIHIWKNNKKSEIIKLNKKYGPLPAKAFPGRAAILLKILNLKKKNIDCIFEQSNSIKIGFNAPGTNIPIESDKYLKKMLHNRPIINLAWHIKKEIKKYIINLNIKSKIINIVDNKDFKK